MALCSVKERSELGSDLVLAPERYDPRREVFDSVSMGVSVGSVTHLVRKTISPGRQDQGIHEVVVFDTSDASEGIVVGRKHVVCHKHIGSAKKLVPFGSVIVSRLRPYLRQVAHIDNQIEGVKEDAAIVCSTEFFVLAPREDRSIAFLVPFLLSEKVQAVLAASQEGGHHPRFNEATLLGLRIPKVWIDRRDAISREFERAIAEFRKARRAIVELVRDADRVLSAQSESAGRSSNGARRAGQKQ